MSRITRGVQDMGLFLNIRSLLRFSRCSFLFIISMFQTAASSSEVKLDQFGLFEEQTTVGTMMCAGQQVQFSKGLRWTPPNYTAVLSIGTRSLKLGISCYFSMSCVPYQGRNKVMVVDSSACGGNALPERYILIDIQTLQRNTLSYSEARRARIIRN